MSLPSDPLATLGTPDCQCGYCAWAKGFLESTYRERPMAHYEAAWLIQSASQWVALAYESNAYSERATMCIHVAALHGHGTRTRDPLVADERTAVRGLVEESRRLGS